METKIDPKIPNHVHTTAMFVNEKEKESKSEIEQRVISLLLTNQILRSCIILDQEKEKTKWKWSVMGHEYWKSAGAIERHIHIVENAKLDSEKAVREFLTDHCFRSLDSKYPQWQLWILFPVLKNQCMIIFEHHDWWFTKHQAQGKIWNHVLPNLFEENESKTEKKLNIISSIEKENNLVPVWFDLSVSKFSTAKICKGIVQSVCEYQQSSSPLTIGLNQDFMVTIDPFQSSLETIENNICLVDLNSTKEPISISIEIELQDNNLHSCVENYLEFTKMSTKNMPNLTLQIHVFQFVKEFKRICVLIDKTVFQDMKKFVVLLESKINQKE